MDFQFLDPRYGTLNRLQYFLMLCLGSVLGMAIWMAFIFLVPYSYVGQSAYINIFITFILMMTYLMVVIDAKRLRDMGWFAILSISHIVILLPFAFHDSAMLSEKLVAFNRLTEGNSFFYFMIAANIFFTIYQLFLFFKKGQTT